MPAPSYLASRGRHSRQSCQINFRLCIVYQCIIVVMAEIFGTAAAALSVAGLFNNCVDCFEYVQMGRQFGRDYERCQLKVDIAQARLSLWGKAAGINKDARFASASPADATAQLVRSALEEIGLLFVAAQKTSKRYELGAKPDDLVLFQDGDMQPVFRRLHGHLGRTIAQRQKQTSLVKKAAWALYDGKNFDRLIGQITGLVDDLEKICPVEAARRQLVQLAIEEVDDEPGLATIRDVAADTDKTLAEAAAQKATQIAVNNRAGRIDIQEQARVRVGNEFAGDALGRRAGFVDQTTNMADTVGAKGASRVHIGNTYGGRGIFND